MALANAADGGFATCFPSGSRGFLDAAQRAVERGDSPEEVVGAALAWFFDAHPVNAADPFWSPCVTFLMAWRGAGGWRLASVGADEARVQIEDDSVLAWPPPSRRFFLEQPHVVRAAGGPDADANWRTLASSIASLELRSWRLALAAGEAAASEAHAEAAVRDAPFVASLLWGAAEFERWRQERGKTSKAGGFGGDVPWVGLGRCDRYALARRPAARPRSESSSSRSRRALHASPGRVARQGRGRWNRVGRDRLQRARPTSSQGSSRPRRDDHLAERPAAVPARGPTPATRSPPLPPRSKGTTGRPARKTPVGRGLG
jgi:hypothetical protein